MISAIKFVCIVYIAWKVFHIMAYKCKVMLGCRENYAKLSWKTIKNSYSINPDKWEYDFVNPANSDGFPIRVLFYDDIPIMMGVFSWIMFRIYFKIYAIKHGSCKENHEATQEVLDDIERDKEKKN